MSPSRFTRLGLPAAVAILFSLTSQSFASINWAGTRLVPVTVMPQYCSGAFRYAARDGNADITPLSPVQMFASDRHFARTRYAARAMVGLEAEHSRLLARNAMCG
jgi:hypothetical protein